MPPVARRSIHLPAPGSRRAVVIGAGSFGTAVAALLARGGLRTILQARTEQQAASLAEHRENRTYLPGVELPRELRIEHVGQGRSPAPTTCSWACPRPRSTGSSRVWRQRGWRSVPRSSPSPRGSCLPTRIRRPRSSAGTSVRIARPASEGRPMPTRWCQRAPDWWRRPARSRWRPRSPAVAGPGRAASCPPQPRAAGRRAARGGCGRPTRPVER